MSVLKKSVLKKACVAIGVLMVVAGLLMLVVSFIGALYLSPQTVVVENEAGVPNQEYSMAQEAESLEITQVEARRKPAQLEETKPESVLELDNTNIGLARRPVLLERLAQDKGWNVICGLTVSSENCSSFLEQLLKVDEVINTPDVFVVVGNNFSVGTGLVVVPWNAPMEEVLNFLKN